mgnify:FL=1
MKTIEDLVLNSVMKDEYGHEELVVSLPEYYERYVKPLSDRFSNSSLLTSRTAICPFHEDSDPSLGVYNGRYHCFGCAAQGLESSGDVIRFHQRIEAKYKHREITRVESATELANMFGLDISQATETLEGREDETGLLKKRLKLASVNRLNYTIRDYRADLMKVRTKQYQGSDAIKAISTAQIKMTAVVNNLLNK